MKSLKEAFGQAKALPTHVDGVLQPHLVKFENFNPKTFYFTLYGEDISPVAIFNAMDKSGLQPRAGKRSAEGYYTVSRPTYREDGTLKKKSEWDKVLMFHKRYSRQDIEIKRVTFDVVGLKRCTSKLSAGVLIQNICFE